MGASDSRRYQSPRAARSFDARLTRDALRRANRQAPPWLVWPASKPVPPRLVALARRSTPT